MKSMVTNKFELLCGIKAEKIEPDILRYEIPKDLHISLAVIKELWEFGNSLFPDKKRKVLGIFNSNFTPSREAADFMVGLKRSEKIAAEAFCIDSGVLRLMTNFYLKVKKPIIPSKVFEDEKKAMAWLNSIE
ncbi:MAG: hypothetical protein IT236_06640 [Bacteroidia bacterium]|nr:hypothetical protein [Bacteroidia bacterium]